MIFNSILRIFVVLVIAIIVMFSASYYKIQSILNESKEISVPNLKGMDILDAMQDLEEINSRLKKKIQARIIPVFNDQYLKYTIISQEPNPTDMVIKEGRTITLVVAKGNMTAKIPNYTNKPFSKVHRELQVHKIMNESSLFHFQQKIQNILNKKAKPKQKIVSLKKLLQHPEQKRNTKIMLIGNVTFIPHESIPTGYIVEQSPKAGETLHEDIFFNFKISSGLPRSIKTKNYYGHHIQTIYPELKKKNIQINLQNVNTTKIPPGYVVGQNIPPNHKIFPDTILNLKIANPLQNNTQENHYHCYQFVVPRHHPLLKRASYRNIKLLAKKINTNMQDILFSGYKPVHFGLFNCHKFENETKLEFVVDNVLLKQYFVYKKQSID